MHLIEAELVLAAHADVGEAPTWDTALGVVVWVDITKCEIHLFDPERGADRVLSVGSHVGAAVPRQSGGFVAAIRDGYLAVSPDGNPGQFVELPPRPPNSRMNDGRCDPAGRFWAGTMTYDVKAGCGRLYRLDEDWTVTTVLEDVTLSNGLGWSPDGSAMYYIDSATSRLDVFDFERTSGAISNRRVLVSFEDTEGMPDGLTVDDEGCIWVALWGAGQLRRYTPDGEHLCTVVVPTSQVTSCAFGGARGDDLYITTAAYELSPRQLEKEPNAGALFHCRPGVSGPPAMRFSG